MKICVIYFCLFLSFSLGISLAAFTTPRQFEQALKDYFMHYGDEVSGILKVETAPDSSKSPDVVDVAKARKGNYVGIDSLQQAALTSVSIAY